MEKQVIFEELLKLMVREKKPITHKSINKRWIKINKYCKHAGIVL